MKPVQDQGKEETNGVHRKICNHLQFFDNAPGLVCNRSCREISSKQLLLLAATAVGRDDRV
jgi:hypothetical protein